MPPLLLAAAGAGLLYFATRKKTYAFETVTGGVTGKQWLTRVVSITGSGDTKQQIVEVWAPAGSWGPAGQLLVVTYQQTGSDKNTRKLLSTGPDAVPAMVTAAGQDFGVKSNPAVQGIIAGVAPDHSGPIIDPRAPGGPRQIGKVDVFHNGRNYLWVAAFNNGRLIAKGRSSTPRQAHRNATVNALRRLDSDRRKARIAQRLT